MARRESGLVGYAPAPGAHQPGEMGLSTGRNLRHECWEMVGVRIRQRLAELSGAAIEWYAATHSSDERRPYAVAFGNAGLSVAEPRVGTDHRPVYAISSFQFAPGSLRHVRVDHRPYPHAPGPSAGGPADAPTLGLGRSTLGLLGNLPPRAQELLQTPFVDGQKILRDDWHYEGHAHHLDMFMFFLAGAKDVTVATGTKTIPVGHTDATAHWSLTCYRASVARRIGR
ncbi:hypothetical protein [Actinomadura sp. NEAU-AAG7]|uniref:hypothetical protein n=1 Tax=Actinomadura sp. NEAU-AAG7 TaxID=2839640 RepID=UPI001BE46022|nr:hypothetical protein [Actinomadura sp. NEAU-AAG7]MBT2211304.1 hypothetical protein [Actinomadura sp. NEAU-AAG7]